MHRQHIRTERRRGGGWRGERERVREVRETSSGGRLRVRVPMPSTHIRHWRRTAAAVRSPGDPAARRGAAAADASTTTTGRTPPSGRRRRHQRQRCIVSFWRWLNALWHCIACTQSARRLAEQATTSDRRRASTRISPRDHPSNWIEAYREVRRVGRVPDVTMHVEDFFSALQRSSNNHIRVATVIRGARERRSAGARRSSSPGLRGPSSSRAAVPATYRVVDRNGAATLAHPASSRSLCRLDRLLRNFLCQCVFFFCEARGKFVNEHSAVRQTNCWQCE